jgi:4-amino-4-deoxy-L-arabinose transferase-like glycosyltransferase
MGINQHQFKFQQYGYLIFIFSLFVYAMGIPVTLMEPDAAVYADVAMEMVKRNNYLEIYLRGQDWLDKPHFQFWITALSYKVFGINNFGYKFPAVLFSLLAILYTFLFGKRFYTVTHGAVSAIILMTAQHFILSNNDVRAEPYLAGLTILSLYYFACYLQDKKFWQLVPGSMGLACLLMTKGLFTILPVVSAIGLTLITQKKWREILNIQWLWVLGLTILFISPSLVGYYLQFDLHPEKEVFGRTGVSGIRFFLWDSQWGRFTNTGPIRGEGDIFFYLHTMLWAFAPWAFLVYFGIYCKIRDLMRPVRRSENLTFFGFSFVFIIFSLSKFQLPHYLNQLFPLMALIATYGLFNVSRFTKSLKVLFILQIITIMLLGFTALVLHLFYFDQPPRIDVMLVVSISWILTIFLLIREPSILKRIIIAPAIFILSINYYLNRQFYPHLLPYQSESEVAFYMKNRELPIDQLVFYDETEWAADFYLKRVIPEYYPSDLDSISLKGKYVFTTEEGLHDLREKYHIIEKIKAFDDFHVTTLTGEFINRKKRSKTLETKWLVRIRQ